MMLWLRVTSICCWYCESTSEMTKMISEARITIYLFMFHLSRGHLEDSEIKMWLAGF